MTDFGLRGGGMAVRETFMRIVSRVLIFIGVLALACSGCDLPTAGAREPVALVDNPEIIITYSGVFTGQSPSGSLNLVIDLVIENRGYARFNASPDGFSVKVSDYHYDGREPDLVEIDLANGEQVSGRLFFQVPAMAASSRVGYSLVYSETTGHKLSINRLDSGRIASDSGPAVLISYTGQLMWVKTTSSLYLLVDMTIENLGYESFATSPEYFKLIIGNIFGQSSPLAPISYDGSLTEERDGAYSDLRSYDLQNGGKLSGKLAFPVPPSVLAATESYRLEYSGLRDYNVLWYKLPIFE
jgi:hypothetical protein